MEELLYSHHQQQGLPSISLFYLSSLFNDCFVHFLFALFMVLCSPSGCALFRRIQVEVVSVETDSQETEKREKEREGLSVRLPQKWSQCVLEIFVTTKRQNIQPTNKMQKKQNKKNIYMYVYI